MMTQPAGMFGLIYLLVALASTVVLFWLAITAIRALNVYIAKNRPPYNDPR